MLRINKKNCLKKLDFVPFFTIFAGVIAFLDVLFAYFALYFALIKVNLLVIKLIAKGSQDDKLFT